MLHVFCGTDHVQNRTEAIALVDSYIAKGAELKRIEPEKYVPGIFLEATESQSMFDAEDVWLIDTQPEIAEFRTELYEYIESMAKSDTPYIVIETKLLAKDKKIYEKVGAHLTEATKVAESRFNVFAITDAIAERDKKRAWLLLQEALTQGIPPEEIAGILWWQLKAMRQSAVTNSPQETDLKPFVYSKAKKGVERYSPAGVIAASQSLVVLRHECRIKNQPLAEALEEWVLEL